MSVFVDAGLSYALQGEETARHDVASRCFETVLDGTYGRLVTSDYVLDETATLVRSQSGDVRQALAVLDRVLSFDSDSDGVVDRLDPADV